MSHQIANRTMASKSKWARAVYGVLRRWQHTSCVESGEGVGLVLGVFSSDEDTSRSYMKWTESGYLFDEEHGLRLSKVLRQAGPVPRAGEARVLFDVSPRFAAIAVAGLGPECVSYSEAEQRDEYKEAVRVASAAGCRALQPLEVRSVHVESFGHAESAAEGSALGVWLFQELRNAVRQQSVPKVTLFGSCDQTGWQIGLQKAAAQNLARQLCETPANLLTPIAFAQSAVEVLCKAGLNVEVKVRNWARIVGLEAFLASARGSCEPPVFLEISYYGCCADIAPVVLIGKGATFGAGGLCLREGEELEHSRGEMAGAAVVTAALRAVAALQLPLNVRGLVPLYEAVPGACSLRPGDVVTARSGKTVLVDDADTDGRLCLADALAYSASFSPRFILDVGTLCRETAAGLGDAAAAVFCNNDSLFEVMRVAGVHTGDRVWRLPLWEIFSEEVTSNPSVDIGDPYRRAGAPCSCAAFLKEHVPCGTDWMHMDTFGVSRSDGLSVPYLRSGMSGRPTRTLVEFLAQLACCPPSDECLDEPIC